MGRSVLFYGLVVLVMTGCGERKKVPLTGEEPVEVSGFIDFFAEAALPLRIVDSSLLKKGADSSLIAYEVFTCFVPDTILTKEFGKTKPKLYQAGRAKEKGKETYLVVRASGAKKNVAYLLCFDRKNRFLNAMTLVREVRGDDTFQYGSIDRKFQITTYSAKKSKQVAGAFKRNVYIYNSAANEFTLILTEPNEHIIEDIINPIDTLPQKNRYTGDYVKNKKNFISFRDGRDSTEILFFVHFEKLDGECIGELKGIARFTGQKKAVYHESGNPCVLEFIFSTSSVTMKESDGCGSYRDIRCFFEGSYPKKKKKKQTKK